ncbi:MAG: ABC transporter permease [Candidatus Lustribacter sp.]|jgi:osmoprotectant transport system permease protein
MIPTFFAHLGTHIGLSLSALAVAVAIGVPVAGFAAGRPAARALTLFGAGALRVVPSIAVLTLTLPYLGLGFRPALLALVALGLPPIVINTELGLRAASPAALDAARGMGMTARQIRRRVEWPLAMPLVFAGFRTASVELVASATLASFIGGGGLGDFIVDGLATDDVGELFLGACSVALLALAVDAALGRVGRRIHPKGFA